MNGNLDHSVCSYSACHYRCIGYLSDYKSCRSSANLEDCSRLLRRGFTHSCISDINSNSLSRTTQSEVQRASPCTNKSIVRKPATRLSSSFKLLVFIEEKLWCLSSLPYHSNRKINDTGVFCRHLTILYFEAINCRCILQSACPCEYNLIKTLQKLK